MVERRQVRQRPVDAGCLLAGDDTGQGKNISLRNTGIQRVVLYRYR